MLCYNKENHLKFNTPAVYSFKNEVCTAATNAINFGSVCPLDRDDPHPKGKEMNTNDSRGRKQIRKDKNKRNKM